MTDYGELVEPLVRAVGLSRMGIFGLPEKGIRGEASSWSRDSVASTYLREKQKESVRC
jgi:hypothetical protein